MNLSQIEMEFDGILRRRLQALALWLLVAAGAVYLFLFQPGRTGFFPACPFRTLTGLNCPGCGTTRGLHQLLHGNFVAAFELNPLMVLMLPVLGYFLMVYTKSALDGRPMPQFRVPARYLWLLSVLILSFWVFRNTSIYPFPA